MRAAALAGLLAVLWAADAGAQAVVTSRAPEGVAVTVYRDGPVDTAELQRSVDFDFPQGLAMITETRTVHLPAGRSVVRFRGVAEGVLPQSAKVEGLAGLEQNFDFDLLTPGALLVRSIGEPVRRVRTNPETGQETVDRGVLRAAGSGVVLDLGGRLEALGCSGLPERLVFDRVPPNLADEPTLSVVVDSPRAGNRTLRLSYLAFGLQWSADYVARLKPDGRTLDLTGWITLANSGRTTFERAPTAVVAGDLNRVREQAARPTPADAERRCWPMDTTTQGAIDEIIVTASRASAVAFDTGGFPPPPPPPPMMAPAPAPVMAEMSELGDYKLYTLPEPTTVAARQTKQVMFLDQDGAAFERLYRADVIVGGEPEREEQVSVLLRLQNTTAAGLGRPLPAGRVTVMERTSEGALTLVGRPELRDVPEATRFELPLGRAFDVTARSRLLSTTDAPNARRRTLEVTVANAKTSPVALEIAHPTGGQAFRIVEESVAHAARDGRPVWSLSVAGGGRTTVRYTIETPS